MPKKPKVDPRDLVAAIALARGKGSDLSELTAALLENFGGERGLANELHGVYVSTQSAHSRAKILDGIVRLVALENQQSKGRQGDLADVPTEDLAAAAEAALNRHSGVPVDDATARPPLEQPPAAQPPGGAAPAA